MSVAHPSVLVLMLREMGFAQSEVLDITGIIEEQLQDPKSLIYFDQFRQLIRNSLRMTNNPQLGLAFGKRLHFTGYNTFVMGAVANKTFLHALRFAGKTHAVVNPSVRLAILENKDHVNVDLQQTVPWDDTHGFVVDTLITACHELVSLFDAEIAAEVVYSIDYPCPPDLDIYSRHVSGKLIFDCPFPRISIPRTFCRRPLTMYNPTAVIEAEKELQNFLERINQQRLALLFEIKELVASHLGEIPAFGAVAAHVHMSPRTLNRRLKAIGTSYKEIVSDTRKRHAFEYLSGNNLTIDQIAKRLGYKDPSNFSKAFKHWTGLSPSEFRDASLDTRAVANVSDHMAH